MNKILIFILLLSLIVTPVVKAQVLSYDLGVNADDIRFGSELLIGENVRLYAKVHNYGIHDITAYVRFYQGNIYIGDSQAISVVAASYPDEVFVDWNVPAGSFNIRAEIKSQEPQDDNPSNDMALTTVFIPLPDTDGDHVADPDDPDDDNDNLTDEEEIAGGTDSLNPDTDADGVSDGNDYYPLDPNKSEKEIPVVVKKPEFNINKIPIINKDKNDSDKLSPMLSLTNTQENEDNQGKNDDKVQQGRVLDAVIDNISKKVLFDVQRINWKTYEFSPILRGFVSQNLDYEWDFDDGVKVSKKYTQHSFLQPRVYGVSLTVTDRITGDKYISPLNNIEISFFNIANYQLWLLILIILIALVIILKILKVVKNSGNRRKKEATKVDPMFSIYYPSSEQSSLILKKSSSKAVDVKNKPIKKSKVAKKKVVKKK